MKLSRAAKIWIDYHKTHSKKEYGAILPTTVIERFIQEFGDGPVEQVTPEQILTFLVEEINDLSQAFLRNVANPYLPFHG